MMAKRIGLVICLSKGVTQNNTMASLDASDATLWLNKPLNSFVPTCVPYYEANKFELSISNILDP